VFFIWESTTIAILNIAVEMEVAITAERHVRNRCPFLTQIVFTSVVVFTSVPAGN